MLNDSEILRAYVDGLFQENSAKFINHISGNVVPCGSADKRLTAYRDIRKDFSFLEILTVPMVGWIEFDENKQLHLLGLFWHSPFHYYREMPFDLGIRVSNLGCILILDCAKPETYSVFARNYIDILNDRLVPIVIAANEYGHPDIWDIQDLKIALNIADDIPIVPCDIETGDNVIEVVITLCNEYLHLYYG